jgi:hypothetical protein
MKTAWQKVLMKYEASLTAIRYPESEFQVSDLHRNVGEIYD